MGFFADIMASMVTSVVGAAGGFLCAPLCNKMKASMDVLNAPESLSEDVKKLSHLMNDIKGMRRSDYIDKWLSEAEKIMVKVPQVLLDRERSSTQNHGLQLSCCIFSHGVTRCKLHTKVRRLAIQGQSIITCTNLNMEPVEYIHGVPNIVDGSTAERNLKQLMNMLDDDEVWSIGVWGPGGVGKTTLVNTLNNKLKGTSSFSLVRLISLTKDANENQVQKAIVESLNLKVEDGMNTQKIADRIHNRLQREKFLFIVDNVWESVNLARVGIPKNQIGSKLVLTTRRKEVCTRMEAKPMKIEYLTETEAWQLFVEKAGDVVIDPTIRSLAEVVFRECGGLPLALVTVGSSMRGKTKIHQWQSAVNDMKCSSPPDGVESQVFKPLKLSFDFLPNETLKSCLLYCSLYPEGYLIQVSQLIQCWLAENIIDQQLNYDSAYSKGLDLIENLKNSSLVEECMYEAYYDDYIKMHDVVHHVARWIGKLNDAFIIFSGHGISKSLNVALPEEVKKAKWISFVDNEKIELPQYKKDFPKVTTLLICNNKDSIQVPEEFLKGFQALRVLNIPNSQSFPGSLLHLAELRALLLRHSVGEMEELPCGTKLKVLDLSFSSIYKLPRGVEMQTNLVVLNLSYTENLKSIEGNVIRSLSALEILALRGSGYQWPTMRRSESRDVVLQDLSRLRSLKEVYLELADVEATYEECSWMERLKSFQLYYGYDSSHWSEHRQKSLEIRNVGGNKVGSFILHAEELKLDCIFGNVNEIFANFNSDGLSKSKLKSISIILGSFSSALTGSSPNYSTLPNLELLCLSSIKQVKSFSQIANALGTTFPKFRRLYIRDIPKLENVFSSDFSHVEVPELEEISVSDCHIATEIFHNDPAKTEPYLPKVKNLLIQGMTRLQTLCNCELNEQWQTLEVLSVRRCPNLKKLPHMTSIKEIRGSEEWWNNLVWDSPETKSYMNQIFKPLDDKRISPLLKTFWT